MTSVNDLLNVPTTAPQQREPALNAKYFPWLFIVLVAVIVFGAVAALTTGGDIIAAAGVPDAAAVADGGAAWLS